VTDLSATDEALDHWLRGVTTRSRRQQKIERSARDARSGPVTLALRFFYKTLEVGPRRAIAIALNFLSDRFGAR
jgi:hypothetical protein